MQSKSTSMRSLTTDMVSRIEYDEKEQECLAKDEQIQVNFIFIRNKMSILFFFVQILEAKIRRLEHLLHLKDIRVEDLSEKLDRTIGLPTATSGASNRQQQTQMPYNGRK